MKRALVIAAAAGLGCNALNGADELTADLPTDGIEAPDRTLGEDGGASSSGGPNGADGGNAGDASTTDIDGAPPGDGSTPASRIRDITFEDKALVHPTTGWDAVSGSAQVNTGSPVTGLASMTVAKDAFGSISFASAADLYVTLRFRLDGAAGSNNADATFLRVTHAGGAAIEAVVAATRELVVRQGLTPIVTLNALAEGTKYRFELRLKSGTVYARVMVDGGGSSSSSTSGATVGASTKLEVGAIAGGELKATFDDVALDRAAQP